MKKLSGILLCSMLFTGCASGPQAPAPVVEVYTGKTFRDFKSESNKTQHKVRKGDTLFSIAFRSGKDFREIAALNQIGEPYTLYEGQVIKLTGRPSSVKKVAGDKSVTSSNKSKNSPSKKTGTTTKGKAIKQIDPTKKQEYVRTEGYRNVNKTVTKAKKDYTAKVESWRWPVSGKLLSSFAAGVQGSKGIDIAGRVGESVKSSADGKVVYAGNVLRGYGNLVIVKHSNDYLSAYAHNSKILVKEQQWVNAGQSIALMGDSDAPRVQLHFEIRYRGKSVDPLKLLPAR